MLLNITTVSVFMKWIHPSMEGKIERTKFPDPWKHRMGYRVSTNNQQRTDTPGMQYHSRYRQSALAFSYLGRLLYLLGWTGLTRSVNYIKITRNFKKTESLMRTPQIELCICNGLISARQGMSLPKEVKYPLKMPGLQTWVCNMNKPK